MEADKAVRADVPNYVGLADIIRSTIEQGGLPDGHLLPSERDLSERYELSRDTVRTTIRLLEDEGTVYSEHGRGTFVSPELIRRASRSADGFAEITSARGGVAGQRVLSIADEPASMVLAGLLGIRIGQTVTRAKRLRLIDRQPVGWHDAYVVVGEDQIMDRTKLEQFGSVYATLRSIGTPPAIAVDNLSVAMASPEEATHLQVELGSPILVCERVAFSDRRGVLPKSWTGLCRHAETLAVFERTERSKRELDSLFVVPAVGADLNLTHRRCGRNLGLVTFRRRARGSCDPRRDCKRRGMS